MRTIGSRSAITILTAFAWTLAACNGETANARSIEQPDRTGQALEVRLGQTVTLKNEQLEIQFSAIANDSRCPADVTCVWEGDAEIVLEVSRANSSPTELRLHTNQRFPQQGQHSGYEIELVSLAPYPISGVEQSTRDYVATLVIK